MGKSWPPQRRASPHPHVVSTPGVCGGRARIDETRIRVYNVVFLHKEGSTDVKIREAYPDLTLAQIQVARGCHNPSPGR